MSSAILPALPQPPFPIHTLWLKLIEYVNFGERGATMHSGHGHNPHHVRTCRMGWSGRYEKVTSLNSIR